MATIVTRSGKGSPLTHAEVDANFTNLNTDKLELSGGTMTGNLSFGDNDKAIFGAGSDLQIYHDGAASYIKESGTGGLNITGNGGNVSLYDASNSQYMVRANIGTDVELYYNGSEKLATTSTGVDITGTLTTSNGLTVDKDGIGGISLNSGGTSGTSGLRLNATDASGNGGGIVDIKGTSPSSGFGELTIATRTGATPKDRFNISSGGDISFYEDTGTTAKFFWDASAESLGIGTTSNLYAGLTILDANYTTSSLGQSGLNLRGSASANGNYSAAITFTNEYRNGHAAIAGVAENADNDVMGLAFFTHSSTGGTNPTAEAMRIDSSGNVGIGTSSVVSGFKLDVVGDARFSDVAGDDGVELGWSAGGSAGFVQAYDRGASAFRDLTLNNAVTIDSSGNVGIGTDAPQLGSAWNKVLHIHSSSGSGSHIRLTDPTSGETGESGLYIGQYGVDSYFINRESGKMLFVNNGSEAMRIDSSGNLLVGTTGNPDSGALHIAGGGITHSSTQFNARAGTGNQYEIVNRNGAGFDFYVNNASNLAARLDSSGNLLVGKTSTSSAFAGAMLYNTGRVFGTVDGDYCARFNRLTSDGDIVQFQKDGTTVGSIASHNGVGLRVNSQAADGYLQKAGVDLYIWGTGYFCPASDNQKDLGLLSLRWDDIYATNGTIQTSDQNEKQDIAELTDAEQRVAVAAKGLLRKFRWRDAVAEKGDEARTHFGIIAQDLQAAFAAEGLDAGDYAMFIHTTWTDEETGEERSRMGVRYSELLAFIIAAI